MCGLGFQSNVGQLNCNPCPAGYTCPSTSDPSLNIPCSLGSYSAEGDINCNACMTGNYCPNTTLAEEFSCPKGSYSKAAAVSCSPCPLGWKCPFTDGHGNAECVLVSFHNFMAILLLVRAIISPTVGNIFSWKLFRVYSLSIWFILSEPSLSSTSLSPWNLFYRRESCKLLMLISIRNLMSLVSFRLVYLVLLATHVLMFLMLPQWIQCVRVAHTVWQAGPSALPVLQDMPVHPYLGKELSLVPWVHIHWICQL